MITLKDDIKDLAESMGAKEFHDLCNQCRSFLFGPVKAKEELTEQDMYQDRKYYENFLRFAKHVTEEEER